MAMLQSTGHMSPSGLRSTRTKLTIFHGPTNHRTSIAWSICGTVWRGAKDPGFHLHQTDVNWRTSLWKNGATFLQNSSRTLLTPYRVIPCSPGCTWQRTTLLWHSIGISIFLASICYLNMAVCTYIDINTPGFFFFLILVRGSLSLTHVVVHHLLLVDFFVSQPTVFIETS